MSLTISEAIILSGRIGGLIARTKDMLVDQDTLAASNEAWATITAALSKAGPKGLRVTKTERKAIVLALLTLLRSLSDVSDDEVRGLSCEIHDVALQLVAEILD